MAYYPEQGAVEHTESKYDNYRVEKESVMAETAPAPLGQDLHEAINLISEIDAQLVAIRKRRAQIQERIQRGLNEAAKHFDDVIGGDRPDF